MFELLPASSVHTDARAGHALTSAAVHAALLAGSVLLTARIGTVPPGLSPSAHMVYLPPVRQLARQQLSFVTEKRRDGRRES
jgi:hypothetical protein